MPEGMKRVNIYIDDSKHRRFKTKCASRGETMTQVLERAIDEYLEEKEEEKQGASKE